MPQIKKILFPVDFSENCKGAARYVEEFAGWFEAEITLLHAVSMGEHNLPEELLPGRQAQLDAFLADELKYFTTNRICVAGDPLPVITDTARTWKPDLVMMPTHGLGFFRRHLLGSVAAKVLHDLDCPVWTSVHAETAPPLEKIYCRRVLCAVNLDERSRSILEWAAWLAKEHQASLGIVHAAGVIGVEVADWSRGPELQQYIADVSKRAIDALQAQAGTAAQVFIETGDPASVIASAATDFKADLLVIGRYGAKGLAGALLNNAFAILRGSPVPVISI
jgi:nucleotide-binding universal stress UspA family protein